MPSPAVPAPAGPGPASPAAAAEPVSELWRTHGSALLRFAQKLTLGDRQRAEDIVQETLLRAWRHPEVLGTGRVPIRPWLFTVARRIAIDMWRTRARTDEIPDGGQPDLPDPADCIECVVTAIDVRAALAALSPPHRQIIIEIYYNNHSVAETAAILGIPPGTVKSRAHYATRQLRRALTPTPSPSPSTAPATTRPPQPPLRLTPAGITPGPAQPPAGLSGLQGGQIPAGVRVGAGGKAGGSFPPAPAGGLTN
jgi:RNA polymerase sigma-70 factor, ECF subfamily